MNSATFFIHCTLTVTSVSLFALALDRSFRRSATTRHAIGLSAVLLIFVAPIWVVLPKPGFLDRGNPALRIWPDDEGQRLDGASTQELLVQLESPSRSVPRFAPPSKAAATDEVIQAARAQPLLAEEEQVDDAAWAITTKDTAEIATEVAVASPAGDDSWSSSEVMESLAFNRIRVVVTSSLPWVVAAAFLGTILMLSRLFVSLVRLRRVLSAAGPASYPLIEDLFTDACERVGVNRDQVSLLVSSKLNVPIAARFRGGVVVLPIGLVDPELVVGLDQILIHELAHLKRRDHWIVLLQNLAAAIYWWNPAIHLVNRRLAEAREEICDNYVLESSEAAVYCQTLLEITQRSMRPVIPNVSVGLFTSRWKLETRVESLLSKDRITATRLSQKARALFVMGLVVFTAVASQWTMLIVAVEPPVSESKPLPRENVRTADDDPSAKAKPEVADYTDSAAVISSISGTVTDQTGTPIKNASVHARYWMSGDAKANYVAATTDASGKYSIVDLPLSDPNCTWFGVIVYADGYAMKMRSRRFSPLQPPLKSFPFSLDFSLTPAVTGTIRIVDESGKPVADALLDEIRCKGDHATRPPLSHRILEEMEMPVPTSNEDGLMIIPYLAGDEVFDVFVSHVDYALSPGWGKTLTDESATVVLERGELVKFVVKSELDQDQLGKAQIEIGHNQLAGYKRQLVDVDESGFAEARLRDIHSTVTVRHPELESRSFYKFKPGIQQLEFSLHRTGTLKGRVIDSASGEGVQGVYVQLRGEPQLQGGARTDQEGRYTVELAEGSVAVSVADRGHRWGGDQDNKVDAQVLANQTVTLDDLLVDPVEPLMGRVLLESGEPVANAIVIVGPFGDHVLSDANGVVELPREKHGSPSIHAIHPTRKLSRVVPWPMDSSFVEIQLAAESKFVGRLLDAAGNPFFGSARWFGHSCFTPYGPSII